jgi:hypothetical protein
MVFGNSGIESLVSTTRMSAVTSGLPVTWAKLG